MYFYLVAPSVIVRTDEEAFTYHSDVPLAVGTLVRVSVGRRIVNGIVLASVAQKPTFKTKAIDDVLTTRPLPAALLTTTHWLSRYYGSHLASALQTVLPTGLQKKRRPTQKTTNHPIRDRTKIVLSEEQRRALMLLTTHHKGTALLHGVTGAGKTQLYIEAAKHHARKGKSSIILVPEIALTPQLVAEFRNHFQNLLVTHSRLTESQRHTVWLTALDSTEPQVVIGPRSALFMPVENIGLIVVDECHEPSYKQEQSPRYSALRAASVLAKHHKEATVVLGSATPSVADYYLAQSNKNPILKLTKPVAQVHPVEIEIIDRKLRDNFTKHRFLSNKLLEQIEETMQKNQQVLLFHNRRGTAPTTVCEHCGWNAECPTCYLPLTLHADTHQLLCHLCGFTQPVPPNCPKCHEPTITFKGIGTKMIETEIVKLFPKSRIARFDADTKVGEAVQDRYQELYDGNIDIIIGTQMLAKGLDLPNLTMVGVVQADSGLMLPDYLAEERVFQLLYQVIGRAGRGAFPGKVVIQTFQPEHPIITAAVNRDFKGFYHSELRRRELQHFPPYRFILKLTCSYKTEAGAVSASKKMATLLRKKYPQLEILGPTPAFYERLGGNYRWQIIVKGKERATLAEITKVMPAGWQADIDPASLL